MSSGLTIGQAADFAGVTVKTVRHYHRLRLVPEPRRDKSGYRRYGSTELLRLIQVRTLAEAGVPLAEIRALLNADPERFAADLTEVKRRLSERIDELVARRDMLDRLASGNRVLLPKRACALLDRGVELGLPEQMRSTAEEGLILAKAVMPDFDAYLDEVERILGDATYMSLLKRGWEAAAWDPHDPRVDQLAEDFVEYGLSQPALLAIPSLLQGNAAAFALINDYHAEKIAPAVARMSVLIDAKFRAARAKR